MSELSNILGRLRNRVRALAQKLVGHLYFELSIFVLILLNLVVIGEEAILPVDSPNRSQLQFIQALLTCVFILELVLRRFAMGSWKRFWRDCWLDVMAILPGLKFLRITGGLRLLRLLRLIRLLRILSKSSVLRDQSRLSRLAESFALITILGVGIVGGTLGLAGYENGFNLASLLDNFWKAIFSFFSTQYVEEYPHTVGGKIVALFVIVSGSFFFALVTGMTAAILGEKLREGGKVLDDFFLNQLNEHMIICGWNSGGLAALRELQNNVQTREREVLIICDREIVEGLETLPLPGRVRVLRDDFTRVAALQKANIANAAVALVLNDTHRGRTPQDADARTVLAALTIEKLNSAVQTCCELSSAESEPHLRMGKVDEIVITGELSGSLLAQAAIDSLGARILHNLLSPTIGCSLKLYPVEEKWLGLTFAALLSQFYAATGLLPVAVRCASGGARVNQPEYVLVAGDGIYCIEGNIHV